MTARSIERLMTRVVLAICLGVIVRWLVAHKLDPSLRGQTLRTDASAPSADGFVVRSLAAPK